MTINLKSYTFEGPFKVELVGGSYQYDLAQLENKSGVYAVFKQTSDTTYKVLDIGESATVHDRIKSHDRHDQWEDNCPQDKLYVGVHYTPNKQQVGRKEIEQELRDEYNPCCGDR